MLQRHLREPRRHGWRDWVFLLVPAMALGFVFALPVLVFIWFVAWLRHRLR